MKEKPDGTKKEKVETEKENPQKAGNRGKRLEIYEEQWRELCTHARAHVTGVSYMEEAQLSAAL